MSHSPGLPNDSGDVSDAPVLFDVGVVALAHSGTPMCDTSLGYVRDAIQGELDAVVPYQVMVGAHHILNRDYGFSRAEATYVLTNFLDAEQIHWYPGFTESDTRQGLTLAREHNIEGWDGFYAHVALTTGATTVITLDDDFERVDDLSVEIPLSEDEREQFHEYLAPG